MKRFIIISLVFVGCLQMSCSQKSEPESAIPITTNNPYTPLTPKELAMAHPDYLENYTMIEKDKQQLIIAIQTLSKLLAQQITLEQATPILGEGEFHLPKTPHKPITDYYFGNRFPKDLNRPALEFGVDGALERFDGQSPFHLASISPSSKAEHTLVKFSEEDYTKKLGLKFVKRVVLADLTLEELLKGDTSRDGDGLTPEQRREAILKGAAQAEYYYENVVGGQKLEFIFYVQTLNKIESRYPQTFESILITNESLKGFKPQSSRVGEPCPITGMWYCKGVSPESGIYLRKGDPMPGQSYSPTQQAAMEWQLIKRIDEA